MKKRVLWTLATWMLMVLSACGGEEEVEEKKPTEPKNIMENVIKEGMNKVGDELNKGMTEKTNENSGEVQDAVDTVKNVIMDKVINEVNKEVNKEMKETK